MGDIRQDPAGELFRLRENAGGSTILGAELSAGYRFAERVRGTLGVAYLHARYADPQLVFDDGQSRIIVRDYLKSPRLSAVAQLIADPIEQLTTYLALRHTGRMTVLNNRVGSVKRTPRFLIADLTVTRHVHVGAGEVDLSVGIKNLFDARQRDVERGAARDSDYVYGPRLPRTLFIRLDAAF